MLRVGRILRDYRDASAVNELLAIWGFFDETVDVQGMLDLNERELRADLKNIEAEHTARVAEAMRKQQRTPEEAQAEHALENAEADARKNGEYVRKLFAV